MNVKLVYVVDDVEVVLSEDTLKKMDFFTFKNFHQQNDVIESDLYKDKLENMPRDGKVVLRYSGFDVPVAAVDFYASLGGDPFSKVHEIDVWYADGNINPTEEGLISTVRGVLDTFEKVDQFREDCFEFFKPYDTMIYGFGAIGRNRDACLEVLESVIDRECSKDEEHFFRRLVVMKAKAISARQDSLDIKNL